MIADAQTELRVQGFHCDLYGHVNNARYLEFLETARWETMARTVDIEDFHRQGWSLVVVRIEIDYRAPTTLGDRLRITTLVEEFGRASVRLRQEVHRVDDQALIAEARVTFVVVGEGQGRPLRLAGELRERLDTLPRDSRRSSES